ncbi:MAG TPA: magnesium and cobalt transport protein CorA [Candidatus Avirikenella pullistercoris]|nr:magnesium and cobalt transport protein CorA [Candidatus Avirikenella pullistercoris]
MLTIYLKSYNKIIRNADVKLFDDLGYDDILWIDMVNPSVKEKRAVEEFMEINLQTQQQMEEIESSSRYSETEKAVFCNTNFLVSTDSGFVVEPVSFVVSEGVLISERNTELKTFAEAAKKLQINYRLYPTGFHILVSVLEVRIDLDADMVESISRHVAQLSRHISLEGTIDKEILKRITSLQDNNMVLRENIFDRQRVLSGVMRSDRFPNDIYPRLTMMLKDVASLLSHADFSLDRLDYLQDTAMGLINIEQNTITKLFTIVSVFFLPATLIASIYGMNFDRIPGAHLKYGFELTIVFIVLMSAIIYVILRRKKWL